MYDTMTGSTEQSLLLELERIEDAIGRSSTFTRWVDTAGRMRLRINDELLALAEAEHVIVQELRRRHRTAFVTSRAAAA